MKKIAGDGSFLTPFHICENDPFLLNLFSFLNKKSEEITLNESNIKIE